MLNVGNIFLIIKSWFNDSEFLVASVKKSYSFFKIDKNSFYRVKGSKLLSKKFRIYKHIYVYTIISVFVNFIKKRFFFFFFELRHYFSHVWDKKKYRKKLVPRVCPSFHVLSKTRPNYAYDFLTLHVYSFTFTIILKKLITRTFIQEAKRENNKKTIFL